MQPDVMIQYEQFRNIAEELVNEFNVRRGQRLVVAVESQHQKSTLESVVLEALKGRGAAGRLLTSAVSEEDSLLRVIVLSQEIVRSHLGDGMMERKAQMIVNARIETSSGEVPVQKVFRRSATDTVSADSGTAPMSVFERLLEPAIVIAGAILVVYLLFTVRSS